MARSSEGRSVGKGSVSQGRSAGADYLEDSFDRVWRLLYRNETLSGMSLAEARRHFSDIIRLAARIRRLHERLGRRNVAEMSPYLESLLRLASAPRTLEPATLREAASF